MTENKYRHIKFNFNKFLRNWDKNFKDKNRNPCLRLMRIKYPANYDPQSDLIFIPALVSFKKNTHSYITLTLSPDVARYLSNALLEGLEKLNLEESKWKNKR